MNRTTWERAVMLAIAILAAVAIAIGSFALLTVKVVPARQCNRTHPCPTSTPTSTPAATPNGWAGKPAFMSYPASGPLVFDGLSNTTVEITGHSFAAIVYPNAAIRVANSTNVTVLIHDNDFNQLEWDAIDLTSVTGTVIIEWNRVGTLKRVAAQGTNRRPDAIQFDKVTASGSIRNNKIKTGGENEDIISLYQSGGTSSANLFDVSYNAIEGGLATSGIPSTSGSGSMNGDASNATQGHIWFHHNTVLNPAQVGVGISAGVDIHVTDNVIYGAQRANSNVGIYTPFVSGVPNPGGHEVARNRVWWKNAAGTANPFWDGGASGTVAGLATNTWQDTTIDPAALAVTF